MQSGLTISNISKNTLTILSDKLFPQENDFLDFKEIVNHPPLEKLSSWMKNQIQVALELLAHSTDVEEKTAHATLAQSQHRILDLINSFSLENENEESRFDFYLTVNGIYQALIVSSDINLLEINIKKFFVHREKFLTGEIFHYCNAESLPSNQLCIQLAKLLFPHENTPNVLLDYTIHHSHSAWRHPSTFDENLPDFSEFFVTPFWKINLYKEINQKTNIPLNDQREIHRFLLFILNKMPDIATNPLLSYEKLFLFRNFFLELYREFNRKNDHFTTQFTDFCGPYFYDFLNLFNILKKYNDQNISLNFLYIFHLNKIKLHVKSLFIDEKFTPPQLEQFDSVALFLINNNFSKQLDIFSQHPNFKWKLEYLLPAIFHKNADVISHILNAHPNYILEQSFLISQIQSGNWECIRVYLKHRPIQSKQDLFILFHTLLQTTSFNNFYQLLHDEIIYQLTHNKPIYYFNKHILSFSDFSEKNKEMPEPMQVIIHMLIGNIEIAYLLWHTFLKEKILTPQEVKPYLSKIISLGADKKFITSLIEMLSSENEEKHAENYFDSAFLSDLMKTIILKNDEPLLSLFIYELNISITKESILQWVEIAFKKDKHLSLNTILNLAQQFQLPISRFSIEFLKSEIQSQHLETVITFLKYTFSSIYSTSEMIDLFYFLLKQTINQDFLIYDKFISLLLVNNDHVKQDILKNIPGFLNAGMPIELCHKIFNCIEHEEKQINTDLLNNSIDIIIDIALEKENHTFLSEFISNISHTIKPANLSDKLFITLAKLNDWQKIIYYLNHKKLNNNTIMDFVNILKEKMQASIKPLPEQDHLSVQIVMDIIFTFIPQIDSPILLIDTIEELEYFEKFEEEKKSTASYFNTFYWKNHSSSKAWHDIVKLAKEIILERLQENKELDKNDLVKIEAFLKEPTGRFSHLFHKQTTSIVKFQKLFKPNSASSNLEAPLLAPPSPSSQSL